MKKRIILCCALAAVLAAGALWVFRPEPEPAPELQATEGMTEAVPQGATEPGPAATEATEPAATGPQEQTVPVTTEQATRPQNTPTEPAAPVQTTPQTPGQPVRTYTVTFRDHDGSILAEVSVREGERVTAPPTPVRAGYTFVGWDGSYSGVTEDRVLTAQYIQDAPTVREYTVTFCDHDGTTLAVRTVSPGGDAPLPADPVRSGYVFAGWQGSHRNINADTTVTASYVSADAPNLFVLGSTVNGSEVRVTLRLTGTVNTCAVEARLDYDETVLRCTGLTKHNGAEANQVNGQLILVYAMPRNVTAATLKDDGVLLEAAFTVIDPARADTELTFLAEHMLVDSVDDNGAYHSETFTLTKGVIHLK